MNHWSRTLLVWAGVVFFGSLYAYFYPQSVENVFMTWGALSLVGLVASSYLANWKSRPGKMLQMFWIVIILFLFTMQVLSIFKGIALNAAGFDLYLEWSVVSSIGYIATAFITRSRQFLIGGIATLFLIFLFNIPQLTPYTPLLYGIPHAALLLILAFS